MKNKFVAWLWKTLIVPLSEPWKSIKCRPFHFFSWFFAVPLIGLAGFWLPLVLVWGFGGDVRTVCAQLLYAGTTASVCVAILGEGVHAMMTADEGGSNKTAMGIRSLVVIWAIILGGILVGTMTVEVALSSGKHISTTFHSVSAVAAIVTACYLYCFRYPFWEGGVKGVDDAMADEEAEISKLCETVKGQTAEGGIKL